MGFGDALGALGSVVGGAIGSKKSKADAQRSMDMSGEALQAIKDIQKFIDVDLSQPLALKQLVQQGIITPEIEQQLLANPSQVAQIQENERLLNQNTQILRSFLEKSRGGLTAEDRTAFNELIAKTNQESEARRQQITMNMATRGMAGSGAELASQLASSQASTQQLAAGGDRLAATAAQRALQSLTQAGALGQQIRQTDFDVARTKGEAEDALSRFNTQNSLNVQQRNVAARNEAELKNLQEKQRVADWNVKEANDELRRQVQAKQQMKQDQMQYAGLKSGAFNNMANVYQNRADQTARYYTGMGQGIGQFAGGIPDAIISAGKPTQEPKKTTPTSGN